MSRHVEFCTFAIFFAQPKLMMYRYIYLLTHKKTTPPYTIAFVEKTELESQFEEVRQTETSETHYHVFAE